MSIIKTVKILESLAQETRLKAFKALVKIGIEGMIAGEIGEKIGVAQNTMSFHLSHLENSGLIKGKKEGRFIRYSANFKAVDNLIKYLVDNCCFDSKNECLINDNLHNLFEPENKIKILILCTGNSCRSIMFEALMNHYANSKFITYSAGSNPAGEVHPLTIKTLQKNNIPTANLSSKSWDQFKDQESDLLINVCDNAAAESCPIFLGGVKKLHLGFNDPAKFIGNNLQKENFFQEIFEEIKNLVLEISQIEAKKLSEVTTIINNLYQERGGQ